MAKRPFQILDELNVYDAENNTRLVSVSNNLISTRTVKQGNIIEMGIPTEVAAKIALGESIAIVVVVDKKSYDKLSL